MSAGVAEAKQYANDVIEGRIVAGQLIISACQRFNNDLINAHERGFLFDEDAAQLACDFFPMFCCHIKGRQWSGQPIELEPWQAFSIANVFGWKIKETGYRRFRTVYEEVARKNAKSTKTSGIGLYLAGFDDEPGAEVYSAATTKDQARIVFNDAKAMINKSQDLQEVFGVYRNNIHTLEDVSKFEPLSADANTLDGLNIHGGILDELHAHKSREVYDVIETATGSRVQSLIYAITTAGSNRQGICYEIRTYAENVLNGLIEDDSFFALIYTLDKEDMEGDNWKDEACWVKANPNLGVSKNIEDMRRLAKKASNSPRSLANFLTKHLNVWVNTASAWINQQSWQKCGVKVDRSEYESLPCYLGLDLSAKLDIAGFVAVFKGDKRFYSECFFYLPEDTLDAKSKTIANMYKVWADEGYLTLTPGNIIDYDYIEEDIRAFCAENDVKEIAFDPWNATQLVTTLNGDDFPCVEVAQTVKQLNEPMKEIETFIESGRLMHNDNPVLSWMASNVEVKEDRNENIFPRKKGDSAENKIDGMVAMITAFSRLLAGDDSGNFDEFIANPLIMDMGN